MCGIRRFVQSSMCCGWHDPSESMAGDSLSVFVHVEIAKSWPKTWHSEPT